MTTKLALILTGIWTLLVTAGCAGAFWFVGTQVPWHERDERARRFGTGVGTVAVVGYAAVWLPWAAAVGRKRREQRAQQDRDQDDDAPPRPRRRGAKHDSD